MKKNEISPSFVLQSHEISRGIYNMATNARKAIALAMAYRKLNQKLAELEEPDEDWQATDILEIDFSAKEFFHAFDIEKSTKGMIELDKVLREITGLKAGVIQEKKEGEKKGKVKYITWIQSAMIDFETSQIQILFSEDIIPYLDGNEFGYCKLLLKDIAELKSFYAFRWMEIAESYESMAGIKGNPKDCWWFEKTIKELREIFGLKEEEYKKFANLRERVIEGPIEEINRSNIGFKLETEYKRDKDDRRAIKSVTIRCRRKERREKRAERTIAYKGEKLIVKETIPEPEIKVTEISKTEYEKFTKSNKGLSKSFEELVRNLAEAKSIQTRSK